MEWGHFWQKKINIHIIVDKASNVKNYYYYLDDCFELTKSNKKIAVAKDFKKIKIFYANFYYRTKHCIYQFAYKTILHTTLNFPKKGSLTSPPFI